MTVVSDTWLGEPKPKVVGNLWRDTRYTLTIFVGAKKSVAEVFYPTLLTGPGDFPRVDRNYDEVGVAIGGSTAVEIVAAAKRRIEDNGTRPSARG